MFECSFNDTIKSPIFVGFFILAFIILAVGIISYFIYISTKKFCCKIIEEGFNLA